MHKGDGKNFDVNWKNTIEARYNHFVRGEVQNQIQFAFRKHWDTICSFIDKPVKKIKTLEVGCGRGSLSAYFADSGADCSLLDLSEEALNIAKKSFKNHNLRAKFYQADCQDLPFKDNQFDVVFSIGLLEHFENVKNVIEEKYRVLKKGGLMFNYIVPQIPQNIQSEYDWINEVLKTILPNESSTNKVEVYRSDSLSDPYKIIMQELNMVNISSTGIYPLPMISNSPSFPFTILNKNAEKIIIKEFDKILAKRKNGNAWLCDEKYGQAILVTGFK